MLCVGVALLNVKKQKEETLYTTTSIPRGGTTLQPAFPVLECQNVVLDASLASPVALEDAGMPEGMPECQNAGMPGMLECSSYFFFFSFNNATPTHNICLLYTSPSPRD